MCIYINIRLQHKGFQRLVLFFRIFRKFRAQFFKLVNCQKLRRHRSDEGLEPKSRVHTMNLHLKRFENFRRVNPDVGQQR